MTQRSSLQDFASLCRALTHMIRGDLSVIVNDLTYLSTVLPNTELDRAKNRCAAISQVLGKLGILQREIQLTTLPLIDLQQHGVQFGPSVMIRSHRFLADSERLRWLLDTLKELVSAAGSAGSLRGLVEENQSICRLTLSSQRAFPGARSYESVSEYASCALGERFVVDGVISDLILRAHGWSCVVSQSVQGVSVSLEIPLTTR